MTVIFSLGDTFWIEQRSAEHNAVATGATDNLDITFAKSGQLIALHTSLSNSAAISGWSQFFTQFGGNSRIVALPLSNVLGVRSRMRNDSGSTLSLNVHLTALMRRPG